MLCTTYSVMYLVQRLFIKTSIGLIRVATHYRHLRYFEIFPTSPDDSGQLKLTNDI